MWRCGLWQRTILFSIGTTRYLMVDRSKGGEVVLCLLRMDRRISVSARKSSKYSQALQSHPSQVNDCRFSRKAHQFVRLFVSSRTPLTPPKKQERLLGIEMSRVAMRFVEYRQIYRSSVQTCRRRVFATSQSELSTAFFVAEHCAQWWPV